MAGGLLAAVAAGLHARALVLVVAVVVVAVAAVAVRAVPARVGARLAVPALLGTVAVRIGQGAVDAALHPLGTTPPIGGSPLGALGSPDGLAVAALGQLWYLLVATAGLAALGAAALLADAGPVARALLDRVRPGRTVPGGRPVGRQGGRAPWAGALVVLGVLGSLALSTYGSYEVALARVARPDQVTYGRYLQQWAPVLVVWAPACGRRAAAAAVAVAAAGVGGGALVLHGWFDASTWDRPVAWHNAAATWLGREAFGADHLVRTGAVAALAVVALGVVAAAGTRPVRWTLPAAVVLAASLLAGHGLVRGPGDGPGWAGANSAAWADRHRIADVAAEAGDPVAVDMTRVLDGFWAYNAQFWVRDLEVVPHLGDLPDGVALVLGDTSTPPVPGAVLVADERFADLGLWALDERAADRAVAARMARDVPAPGP